MLIILKNIRYTLFYFSLPFRKKGGFRMKRTRIAAIGFMLIIAASVLIVYTCDKVSARTYVVDSQGGGDYPTIQQAIDVASNGDTINVRPGNGYSECLFIHKELHIIGTQGTPTIRAPPVGNPLIEIRSYSVKLKNFDLDSNGYNLDGIYVTPNSGDVTYVEIENVEVYNFDTGIYVDKYYQSSYPENISIRLCDILDCTYGIELKGNPHPFGYEQDNYLVEYTYFFQNNWALDIDGDNSTIRGCMINATSHIAVDIWGDNNTLEGNELDGSSVVDGGMVGIGLTGSNNSIQDGVKVTGTDIVGIQISNSLTNINTHINHCNISSNSGIGIYAYDISNLRINDTLFSDHQSDPSEPDENMMVYATNCTYVTIENCTFTSDGNYTAVYFRKCDDINITKTNFTNFNIAIRCENVTGLEVYGQAFTYNSINDCTYAFYITPTGVGCCSSGWIYNYFISSNTTIYLRGYDLTFTTIIRWKYISNEANTIKDLQYASWSFIP